MAVEVRPTPAPAAPAEALQVQITMGPTRGGRLRNAFTDQERAVNRRMDDAEEARANAERARLAELRALVGDVPNPEKLWSELSALARGEGSLAGISPARDSVGDTRIQDVRTGEIKWVSAESARESVASGKATMVK